MVKEALVVPREILFKEKYFQGFLPLQEHDYLSVILKNFHYHPRGDELENNESLQQIIPYVWIIDPENKTAYLYKRILNGNKQEGEFRETRYLNKYSGGIGGHIDRDTEQHALDPISAAAMRELKEEVFMDEYPYPEIIGYINDDLDSLGKVHFGIVAVARTTGSVVSNKKEGLDSGEFHKPDEIDKIFSSQENEVESWTSISWPYVKEYLLSK